ncbi:NAD(P)-dependent dehydrogenase, short-chain alcohol dehydrogenase family [Friedmanniella luteola]|uniref:NAD(P)-dependent dehydrogenase, short-chain alcohol dehydrogenase family n=1 Tax=Friedmanniella luteola TaxID=546871 RepID=A0A1H1Z6Q6_9ACTN|nr:SDR family oxidoreductase [Friedmanniella luteola]SDT29451.1 NAD(P)-dependent dehydrogenase, short-chain alcohol dehydrogenase family [Friedmanniella luteola]
MSGRGVLVTGSSRGVGAATAQAFAARGDRVVVHYRAAEDRARELLDSLPGEGHALVRADLADPAQVQRLAAEAFDAVGRVDVLVNNAALFLDPADGGSRRGDHRITDVDYDAWVRAWQVTLATNLLGAANLTWCVARHMIDVAPAAGAPRGRIVNVGSRGAYRGEPDVPAYGASKAGLHAFGQSMAIALAPEGIAVVSLAPGFIATDMASGLLDAPEGDAIRAQSPFGRVATPEEVAGAVLALAEPGAEWVSGAVVDFNGASYLR